MCMHTHSRTHCSYNWSGILHIRILANVLHSCIFTEFEAQIQTIQIIANYLPLSHILWLQTRYIYSRFMDLK